MLVSTEGVLVVLVGVIYLPFRLEPFLRPYSTAQADALNMFGWLYVYQMVFINAGYRTRTARTSSAEDSQNVCLDVPMETLLPSNGLYNLRPREN